MWQYGIVEQLSQSVDAVCPLGGGNWPHHEFAERIGCGDVIVDGIVEHGTDIAEVYAPGVLRRLVFGEEPVELREPVLVDLLEGELPSLGVVLLDALQSLLVDFPCALFLT